MEKLLFSQCHLNRKDLQLYVNRRLVYRSYFRRKNFTRRARRRDISFSFFAFDSNGSWYATTVRVKEKEEEREQQAEMVVKHFRFSVSFAVYTKAKTKRVYCSFFFIFFFVFISPDTPIGVTWRDGKRICYAK